MFTLTYKSLVDQTFSLTLRTSTSDLSCMYWGKQWSGEKSPVILLGSVVEPVCGSECVPQIPREELWLGLVNPVSPRLLGGLIPAG